MPPYPELIEIPGGAFTMGSKKGSPYASVYETPEHSKHVSTFYLAKYPVTNQEYAAFVRATNHSAPIYWNCGGPPANKLDHPVVEVDFDDAIAYCKWLSKVKSHTFRLPCEEEWEKAARGTDGSRIYTWGDDWISINCNSSEDGYRGTTSVQHYENAQKNFYGIVDLLGNVWEWVDSYFAPYLGNTSADLEYKTEKRIVRGGSYMNDRKVCRVSKRGRYDAGMKRPYLGFRIASDTPPPAETKLTFRTRRNTRLRIILEQKFNLSELNTLITDLGLNPDNFPEILRDRARELVAECDRHGRIKALMNQIKQERPNINWEDEIS